MGFFIEGIKSALNLLFSFNRDVYSAVFLSLRVTTLSTLFAAIIGVPLGFIIGLNNFYGKRVIIVIFNTLYSLPTVLMGLFAYGMFSRNGPLGSLGLLYTPQAMIIGQTILIFPLITALTISAVQAIDKKVFKTCLTLGANYLQSSLTAFFEYKQLFVAAVIAGFGRAFGEVGVSMMLGGNIRGYTRNITTSIAFATAKGEFALGIALGLILLLVACLISILLQFLQRGK
ncbi:MAG: ABC transporter permease [Elusimicrobia bacterium]|nr:ABC transporter permease [Elusimicrobiota bacterium]